MAVRTFKPFRGKRIRVTTLDLCGRLPEAGAADAFITTDGFVSVQFSSVVEDGAEVTLRNANGDIDVNEKLPDSFKRLNVQIGFSRVNPALVTKVSNAKGYFNAAGDNAGFTLPEGKIEKWFALELWTGLSGTLCDPGVEEASGYIVVPFVQAGTLGDITVDGENAVSFTMQGAYTKGGNQWGVGPYHVAMDDAVTPAPDFLPTPLDPFEHFLILDTGIAPPPIAEDPQPMVTDGASTTTTTTTTV